MGCAFCVLCLGVVGVGVSAGAQRVCVVSVVCVRGVCCVCGVMCVLSVCGAAWRAEKHSRT